MIPKKLYFTYKTEKPPEKYLENLQLWHDLCFDWELHYFSNKQIYTFFENHLPEYREDLPKISHGAVLADVFRYGVLYVQGGMYNDIDTLPLKKIPEKWLDYDVVIGYEHQPSNPKFSKCCPKRRGNQDIFCQWSLLASPGYPLYKEALEESFKRLRENNFQFHSVKDNLTIVGPQMFTQVAKKYTSSHEVLTLDMDYFGAWENNYSLTERSVVRHLFHGYDTWKQELKFPHLRFY